MNEETLRNSIRQAIRIVKKKRSLNENKKVYSNVLIAGELRSFKFF